MQQESRLTPGGLAMIIVGGLLLVPGACSLYFFVTGFSEIIDIRRNGYAVFLIGPILFGLVPMVVGILMMRNGWRRRRSP